ncbi:major facilitator superfamily domain-containing protein [Emericellopsis cladophorae]|uniref:Major facilitator superfamily domain-containing protein n=1 Tax=Emericellopsis cladophorae TaxID=2686198 RepID=A0A9P9Y730_9HYPO|nr:major facilitator superfamily domain-containing protein [Emericellopsis cladophorae]KAI6784692.1 major facilitator superfamily domain-containing protein [Emericellopsis cladophorae]
MKLANQDAANDDKSKSRNSSSNSNHDNDAATPPAQQQADTCTLPLPPPDGGFRAWAQVVVAHLGSFNGWGYMTSFGLFQSYYTDTLLPGTASSSISWIGSLQIFLAFAIGSVSGRALDMGYLRQAVIAGTTLQILAIMTASVSSTYWQLLLTQGLCKGLGDGLVFCPTVANVPTYFSKRRAVAMAIAASGTSTGGVVFPLIAQQLMPRIGYGWTVRVMGFIVLFNAAVMLALVKPRFLSLERKNDSKVTFAGFFEWSAFREPPYTLFCTGMFAVWLALYFAFYYVSQYGKDYIAVDTSTSLTLLLAMNAIGAPSRVIFGFIADKCLGLLHTLILAVLCTSVMFYSWIAVRDLPGLFAFSCLYGSFAAAVQALFPASCASLTKDVGKMGARTGMAFAVVSVATLTGPPLGGALVQAMGARGGGYLYAQVFGGSVLVLGAGLLVLSSWYRQKGEKRQSRGMVQRRD